MPLREHKLLTSVPLPNQLLVDIREQVGLDQRSASELVGYRHASDLNNIERRSGRDSVRWSTLRRIRDAYAEAGRAHALPLLDRLIDGDLMWDEVVAVRDTGEVETIYDIEVCPGGRHIENFLAGHGGVFVSNTAGFVDAGWDGHLTLELSNVATLPIALYPGMKIGQISFFKMSSPVDRPYGSPELGSKYQGQSEPTASAFHRDFDAERRPEENGSRG
jgi:dCTP deaminase